MEVESCELRLIDDKGERTLRTGSWEEHLARLELPSTPNGTYAIVSATRRVVISKTGNQGPGGSHGTLTVIEDSAAGEPDDEGVEEGASQEADEEEDVRWQDYAVSPMGQSSGKVEDITTKPYTKIGYYNFRSPGRYDLFDVDDVQFGEADSMDEAKRAIVRRHLGR